MTEKLVKVGNGHYAHLNDGEGHTMCGREVSGKITANDRRTGTYPLCKLCAGAAPERAEEYEKSLDPGSYDRVLKAAGFDAEIGDRWGVPVFETGDRRKTVVHAADGTSTLCGRKVNRRRAVPDGHIGWRCPDCLNALLHPAAPTLEDVLAEGDALDERWGPNVFAENDVTDAHSEREHGATWCGRTIDYGYTERCHVERPRWAAGVQRCAECVQEIQKPAASEKLVDVLMTRAVREVVNEKFRKLPRWLLGPGGKTKHMREGADSLVSMCGILLENTSFTRSTAGGEFCQKCGRKARAQEKRGEEWGGGEMLGREMTSGEIREEMRRGLMTMNEFARERGLVWSNGRPVTFSFTENRCTLHVQPESDPDEGPTLCGVDTLSILQGHDRMGDHGVEGSSVCEPCRVEHGYRTAAAEGSFGFRKRGAGEQVTFDEVARDNGLVWKSGKAAQFATENRVLEKVLHVMPPGELRFDGPALCGQKVRNILPGWAVLKNTRLAELSICRTCRELGRGKGDRLGRSLGKAIAGIEAQDESCLVWAHCEDCRNKPGPCACSGDAMARQEIIDAALGESVRKGSVYSDVPAIGVREALEQLLEAYTDHYGPGGVGAPGSMQRAYHCVQVDLRALLEKYPAGE